MKIFDLGVVKNQNMTQTNKYQIVHNHIKVPLSRSVDKLVTCIIPFLL